MILSTDDTCSASESVINGLRGVGVEVVLIGDRTCGKPYAFIGQDNCGITYYPIQSQGQNALGFGGYEDGFMPQDATYELGAPIPGCVAPDVDVFADLGDPTEVMTQMALDYLQTGTCSQIDVTAEREALSEMGVDVVASTALTAQAPNAAVATTKSANAKSAPRPDEAMSDALEATWRLQRHEGASQEVRR